MCPRAMKERHFGQVGWKSPMRCVPGWAVGYRILRHPTLVRDIPIVGVVRTVAAREQRIHVREDPEWIRVARYRPHVKQVAAVRDPASLALDALRLRDAAVEAERLLRAVRARDETDAAVKVPVVVRAGEALGLGAVRRRRHVH